jgi:ribulose bisphosphate carboxylase small subunit
MFPSSFALQVRIANILQTYMRSVTIDKEKIALRHERQIDKHIIERDDGFSSRSFEASRRRRSGKYSAI